MRTNRIINHVQRWLAESIRKRNGEALLDESTYKEKDPGEDIQAPVRASYNTTADVLCQLCEGTVLILSTASKFASRSRSVNVRRLDCEGQICCDEVAVRGQHDQGVSA